MQQGLIRTYIKQMAGPGRPSSGDDENWLLVTVIEYQDRVNFFEYRLNIKTTFN